MTSKRFSTQESKGLTLIELLLVIAILGIFAGTIFFILGTEVRAQQRDIQRIAALKSFHDALELYYARHLKYPSQDAADSVLHGFDYSKRQPDGSCSGSIAARWDNSASTGFLEVLFDEGFLIEGEWHDPLDPDLGDDSSYNCRYVILNSERVADDVQHYLLHCNLESTLEHERTDNGTNDTLYEIIQGDPWICVTGTYN